MDIFAHILGTTNVSMCLFIGTLFHAAGDPRSSNRWKLIKQTPFAFLNNTSHTLYLREARQKEKERFIQLKEKQSKNQKANLGSKTWITRGKKPSGKKLPLDSLLMI